MITQVPPFIEIDGHFINLNYITDVVQSDGKVFIYVTNMPAESYMTITDPEKVEVVLTYFRTISYPLLITEENLTDEG